MEKLSRMSAERSSTEVPAERPRKLWREAAAWFVVGVAVMGYAKYQSIQAEADPCNRGTSFGPNDAPNFELVAPDNAKGDLSMMEGVISRNPIVTFNTRDSQNTVPLTSLDQTVKIPFDNKYDLVLTVRGDHFNTYCEAIPHQA